MCPFPSENARWAEMWCNSLQEEEDGEYLAMVPSKISSVINHQIPSPSADDDFFPVKRSSVDPNTKKLFHNANERRRRKKLNALYSNLRSVLPNHGNAKKKLSVPAVVCRVVKYIPQLRAQIENLSRQRDELKISEAAVRADALPKVSIRSSQIFPNVNIIRATDSDLLLSIFAHRARVLFSTILLLLEEQRLEVLNASTFVSDDKICYNLHLKVVAEEWMLDADALRLKLLFLCE